MKNLKYLLAITTLMLGFQQNAIAHEMQHGFILTNGDAFASHLVAIGHHSRQTEVLGRLAIQNLGELENYEKRKKASSTNQTYFLFQAQELNLPGLKAGMVLRGHIVESRIGQYEPKNIIVKSATYYVQRVLINIPNPFFADP